MYEKEIKKIRKKRAKMAICYDFDKTLSPDDMQAFTLIPSFGIDNKSFWEESNKLAKDNLMDNNLSWMYQLLNYSKLKRLPIRRDYFNEIGADVQLYNGVEGWFNRVNKYAEQKGIDVEHYIISSGLKEIIEGNPIASNFRRIYASSYLYSTDGVAEWPAQAVNYTNKTQFIFRIAKGFLEEYDERVNYSMPSADLVIPYENIVYIGDSLTDIPCMRLVKSKGGYSIGVYDPIKNNRSKVYQLYIDGRISFYAPANYSANSEVFNYMKQIIDEIATREVIKTEQEVLDIPANIYKTYKGLENISTLVSKKNDHINRNEFLSLLKAIEETIEGNIK